MGWRNAYLQLPSEAEQLSVFAEAADKLRPDRQPGSVPVQQHRHRLLTRDVEQCGVGHVGKGLFCRLFDRAQRLEQPASVQRVDDPPLAHLVRAGLQRAGGAASVGVSGVSKRAKKVARRRATSCSRFSAPIWAAASIRMSEQP